MAIDYKSGDCFDEMDELTRMLFGEDDYLDYLEENEDYEEERYKSLVYMKNKEEAVIKKWLDHIGFNEPVGYYRNVLNHVMEIYTTRPGVLIGKAGVNVKEFKKMLSEEFFGEWEVKFVEIRGGFVLHQ